MKAKEIYDFLCKQDYKEVAKALFIREFDEIEPTNEQLEEIYNAYEEADGLTLISQDIIDLIDNIERNVSCGGCI